MPVRQLTTVARWVITVATALALAGCRSQAQTPAAKSAPQPVRVAVVAYASFVDTWSAVGVVRPRTEVDVGFRIAGKITARGVEVGQTVTAGQVIARLDPTDYGLAVETQQAELRASVSVRGQAIAAEARFKTLLAGGHVAQAALDQRIATADEARARVDRAERALAIARNQLAYADLTADRAGVVTAVPVEVGQVVAAGQTVARLAERGAVDAVVGIPETRRADLEGATATADLWNGDGGRIPVRLRELSPEADRVTRTYQARFAFEQATAELLLGRTVTVHLSRGAGRTVARLPLAAVVSEGAGASVWVVDAAGTGVTKRTVDVVQFATDHVLVGPGLTDGERIVSLGAHLLDPGKPVRVVEQRADAR